MNRPTAVRRAGIAIAIAGAALSGWGLLGGLTTPRSVAAAVTDPGCTPSAAGPGTVTVCLHEDQEGTTAAAFSDHSCDNVENRDPSLDYFIFVLPASGDAGRHFIPPAPTVVFDTGTASGTISSSNAKFFFASASPGTTLLEATATADNGSGTPTGGEAQVFNLTHTCPANTTPTATPTPAGTPSPGATPTPAGTPSPGATPTPAGSPSPGGTPTPAGSPSPGGTPTPAGSPSPGSTPTASVAPATSTPSPGGTPTAAPSPHGGVLGLSTTSTPGGGVGALATTPNTGAASGVALLMGLLLMGGGAGLIGLAERARRPRNRA